MATVTDSGIQIKRLDTLIDEFEAGFRRIYGQNINLDPDTPDGQLIGILAQIQADNEEVAELVYKQLDPDLATGTWLEQRVAYAGLRRKAASYSYLRSVLLTGVPGTKLFAGLTISDTNKTRWILVNDCELSGNGTVRADFRSESLGAFSLPEDIEMTIETITLGLNTATTTSPAEVGEEEETDAELRQRFFRSRHKNAENSLNAIHSAISQLSDVKNVIILENNTDTIDDYGVKPHSLNIIVEGGNDEDIAKAISENKGAGVGLQGDVSIPLKVAGAVQQYRFDRVKYVDIAVHLVIVRDEDGTEIDRPALAEIISSQTFEIGRDVQLSRMYTPINTVKGFWVESLKIAKLGTPFAAENIYLTPREKGRILAQNITIEIE